MAAAPGPTAAAPDDRPNIVLVTTDDMTDYDLAYMPETRSLIQKQGLEFTDFLSQHPLCCPARAELLTGQYGHNNGVHHNDGPWGAVNLRHPHNNVGRWLDNAGYQTAFVGKFLNGWQFRENVDLGGWDIFNPSIDDIYSPYQFTYYNDGNPKRIEGEYTADYVGRKTVEYVDRFSSVEPFFIHTSQVAPHAMRYSDEEKWQGAIPAERHEQMVVPNPAFPAKPSFNEANVSDKPKYLRAKMAVQDRGLVVAAFKQRIRSLRAVDEQVGNLVDALGAAGELENTLILFTSDNGFMLGEHRLVGKNYPYEEALQVPMLMRGPGVPVGATPRTMTMVDVAATIADAAGVTPERVVDGRSMLPVAQAATGGYGYALIQGGHPDRAWSFRGVRNQRWMYAEHYTGAVELYDRAADPFQLKNLAGKKPGRERALAARLDQLRKCVGVTCLDGGR